MPFITLDTAANEIKQACENAKKGLPFFFLVGAGISSPPIPLASEIVERCEAIARMNNKKVGEASAPQPIEIYSHWFRKAYPQRKGRQEFLRDLIDGKPISYANFRLAHLLLNKSVANLVVTTNFDDFLSRALTLFGKPYIICDHPQTIERIDAAEKDDIQIMHVHGSYWFYDCCNLNDEIARRAKLGEHPTETMAGRLEHILLNRSPLVIGYSGWEGDIFMTALKRRIKGHILPYNLYWFCYRQASVELLPDWLKDHPDVYFVVPEQSGHEPVFDLAGNGRLGQSQAELLSHAGATATSDKESDEPVLPAHKVLDELIHKFQLKAPELTSEPLKFFASHLRTSLPQHDSGKDDGDTYRIMSVVERIERAQAWEQKHHEAMRLVEKQLETVRDAVRRCQYQEAIQQGSKIHTIDLTVPQLQELLGAMASSANSLNDNLTEKFDGYKKVVEIEDVLAREYNIHAHLEVAKALISKGVAHSRLYQHKEALASFDKVIRKFRGTADQCLRVEVARALNNRGAALSALDRKSDAIAAYAEVLKRFDDATDTPLLEQQARALVNMGVTHSRLCQHKEALAAYDEVLNRFGGSDEPALVEEIAGALLNKGVTLRQLERELEAIKVYDEVLNRFGQSSEPALREEVARALINKGVTYSRLSSSNGANVDYRDKAIASYQEVVKRFADATEANLQRQVARALVNLGVTYSTLEKRSDAIAAYEKVIERFDKATEPVLQEQVANALNGIGFQLICEAKRLWKDHKKSARNNLSKARDKISAALEKVPAEEPVFLGNLGYIEFLLGDKEKALELLTRAIHLGGVKIRDVELDDSKINTVPPDKEFRKLITSIPVLEKEGSISTPTIFTPARTRSQVRSNGRKNSRRQTVAGKSVSRVEDVR